MRWPYGRYGRLDDGRLRTQPNVSRALAQEGTQEGVHGAPQEELAVRHQFVEDVRRLTQSGRELTPQDMMLVSQGLVDRSLYWWQTHHTRVRRMCAWVDIKYSDPLGYTPAQLKEVRIASSMDKHSHAPQGPVKGALQQIEKDQVATRLMRSKSIFKLPQNPI